MAGSLTVGDVVFRKGELEDGSDIWDDTALIEAYDNAISAAKAKLMEKGSISEGSQDQQTQGRGQKKHKRGRRKHKRDAQRNKRQAENTMTALHWRVGDHCRAVFTEDGSLYEAVIRSLDKQEETCVVRYLGYGNEEEQALTDLLPSEAAGHKFSAAPSDLVMSEGNNSMETDEIEWNQPQPSPRPGHSPRSPRGAAHRHHSSGTRQRAATTAARDWPYYGSMPSAFPGYPGMSAMPPPPPPMSMPFMPGMMPPYGIPNMPAFPPAPSSSHMPPPHLPEMPPPPLLTDDDEEEVMTDKEALHTMLISWYMSGYHTGYYQGLKHAKKSSSTSSKDNTPTQSKDTKQCRDQTAATTKDIPRPSSPDNR